MWASGDFPKVALDTVPQVGPQLVAAARVGPGQRVLDVAAGSGATAIPAAQAGADVVASDLTPELLAAGRARAEGLGLALEWVEADAEALPFEDGRFDCVGSVFGAMIAPRPRVVAEELFRVVRPGGTVGMTAWTPNGFSAELFRLGRSYAPPSDDQHLSDEWSVEENVRERFDGLAARFELEVRTLPWRFDSPEEMVETLGTSAPPWVAAKQNLPPERWESLQTEARELAERWAGDARPIEFDNEYALIVARKRG
jgi:ubiquinone/menaquinone biosynthesis C-methylase UbiE